MNFRSLLFPLRRVAKSCALCCLPGLALAAHAQDTAAGPIARAFTHVDLGVSGAGMFTGNSSGTNYLNQPVSLQPSSTISPLVQVRYTQSPYIGFEFTYARARQTEDFRYTAVNANGTTPIYVGIQVDASEYSFGYVAHPRQQLFGLQPFVAVGAGSTAFRPTRNGGQGYTAQARATYYYAVGVEQSVFNPHFGLRAQFRQTFFLAPDFQTNYLRIQQRTNTVEPAVGFYLHF